MTYTIRADGKLYNEGGKSVPFKELEGQIVQKSFKVKAGKEKGAVKIVCERSQLISAQPQYVSPPAQTTDYSSFVAPAQQGQAQEGEGNQCRIVPFQAPKGPNKFLKLANIKADPERGYDKIKDDITPTPRIRGQADTQLYNVVCFFCNRAYQVPKSEVPAIIEGEQMAYRCQKCLRR